MSAPASTVEDAIQAALATVNDPEIRRPITELDMVRSAVIGPDGVVRVELLLTVAGCPCATSCGRTSPPRWVPSPA